MKDPGHLGLELTFQKADAVALVFKPNIKEPFPLAFTE